LKIRLNIIFPSMSGSPQWSLSLRFSHQNPLDTSPLPIRTTCNLRTRHAVLTGTHFSHGLVEWYWQKKLFGEKHLSYTNLISQFNYTIYLMSTFLPRSKQTPSVLKKFSVCARSWKLNETWKCSTVECRGFSIKTWWYMQQIPNFKGLTI
jgi:hypothetical protein